VNLIERGGNYGWNVREGRGCFRAEDCPTERDGETLIDPIVEYPHDGEGVVGIAVIGGHVYGGSAIPGLAGRYLFADWRTDGRLFVATEPGADADGDGGWSTRAVDVEGPLGRHVLAFGREPDGELLVCTSDESGVTGSTGALLRVIPG
jgi:glucose/arabinose dehydrogenase